MASEQFSLRLPANTKHRLEELAQATNLRRRWAMERFTATFAAA